MPAWALRLAVVITGLSMLGSTTYALAHPKNANAPLQPPVAEKPRESLEPEAEPTVNPFRTLAPTPPSTPTPSPTASPRPSASARATAVATTPAPTRAPTVAPTLRPTPVPLITLAAGVRVTALPKVTVTHAS